MPHCLSCGKLKKSPSQYNDYTCDDCRLNLGKFLRDQSLEQIKQSFDEEWKQEAFNCIVNTALNYEYFTMDQVHDTAARFELPPPREPKIWGALAKSALSDKIMEPTGEWVQSTRPIAHARPIRVYRSLTWIGGRRDDTQV